jgi:hypothetical protein
MINLLEFHEVIGGKMADFSEAMRDRWMPLVERDGLAKVLWFWELAMMTSASYTAVSMTAVRDWQSWGILLDRMMNDPAWREWNRDAYQYRRDIVSKLLIPNPLSPLKEFDFSSLETELGDGMPPVYLLDTGWPYPGKVEEYADALHEVYQAQVAAIEPPIITVVAGWRTCPGSGRWNEAHVLSKIHNWEVLSNIIPYGVPHSPDPEHWMTAGLKYRDRWESRLLRLERWSPYK